MHDVEIGTRLEKIEMAIGQENQAEVFFKEANVAYSERYIIATNDMEIETISLNVGNWQLLVMHFQRLYSESTYFRFTIPESKISKYQKE